MKIKRIQEILKTESDSFKRFEILEHYSKYSKDPEDILFLLKLLIVDPDPMVRHEIAAQLLRLEMFRSDISKRHRKEILSAFKERIKNDTSIIVKHECLEALGYIGEKSDLEYLSNIINEESNEDIVSTAKISLGALTFRTEKNLEPGEFWNDIFLTASKFKEK